MKRVTCREIGEKLGVSHALVSMALRDHPAVAKATKEKIRKMAMEMGYRPDPALGALNAYRQARRTARYQSTLAWVHLCDEAHAAQGNTEWYHAAARRAGELGFLLERFHAPAYADWQRLARTLKARGIQGIVRMPVPWQWADYDAVVPATYPWRDFPWEDFSAISIGAGLHPAHHRVISNQFQSASLAVSELAALGYRKIGIVLHSIGDRERVDYWWLGGYLAECLRQGIKPSVFVDGPVVNSRFAERVAKWVSRARPEAVIASGDGDILPGLRHAKMRVPGDIAVAVLAVMEPRLELAAIDQNNVQIGETAINQLVDLIRRNERGIPSSPMRYHVEGIWKPGPSAPPVLRPRGKGRCQRRTGIP